MSSEEEEDVIYINTDPPAFGPGEWNRFHCNALRCRTPEKIKFFIQVHVPGMVSLLCSTCSHEAFYLIKKRHPNNYKNKLDHRGENIGMWLWSFDLHNDVNHQLQKPEISYEQAAAIYAPLLNLTTKDLEEESINISSPLTMDNLKVIEFITNDDDEIPVIPHKEDEEKPVDEHTSLPILERQIKSRGRFQRNNTKKTSLRNQQNKETNSLNRKSPLNLNLNVKREQIKASPNKEISEETANNNTLLEPTNDVVIPQKTMIINKGNFKKTGRRMRLAPTGRCTSCGNNKK